MKRSGVAVVLILLGCWLACAGESTPVWADSPDLAVGILFPGEGETLYAGPPALLFNIRVTGWVRTKYLATLVQVKLQVTQGGRSFGELTTRPQPDGSFEFVLTANPGADGGGSGLFNPEHDSCWTCHYPGNLDMPGGASTIRVIVTDPDQRQAEAERRVIVDRAGYSPVTVRVVKEGEPDQAIPNVKVTAATWLYQWRTRRFSSTTGQDGRVTMKVEALAQAPTTYAFWIEPSVVDGILYEGVGSAGITLPSGATTAPPVAPVTLQARGRLGKLSGKLSNSLAVPVTIHAIRWPSGQLYSIPTSPDGAFEFPPLPIASYVVKADDGAVAALGYSATNQTVDLLQSPSTSITIPVVLAQRGFSLQGRVQDEKGNPLPFAWVADEKAGSTQRSLPDSGTCALGNLPNGSTTAIASAPGYYNLAQLVDSSASRSDFGLTRRPDTRSIPWGTGEVVVPYESQVVIDQERFSLEYGWLWGSGGADHPLTIRVADGEVVVVRGRFAIEYLTPKESGWLYVMDGDAEVRPHPGDEPIAVRAGEMVAMTKDARWVAVPIDPVVVAALRTNNASPLTPQWEPTFNAQVRDRLAQMGIGLAQLATLITYASILPGIVVGLMIVVKLWAKHRAESKGKSTKEQT